MNRYVFIVALFLACSGCATHEQAIQSGGRIIFFGDSITQQGENPKGYVSLLRSEFAGRDPNAEIIGAGVSGNKISDLLARAEKDVLSKKPTIVVIYIGINDVWHFEFASRGLTGTPKEQFESGLKELIGKITSAGAKVVLCTPSVIGEKNDGSNKYDAMLDEYSGISRRVAAETGSTICDLRKAFRDYLQANNPTNAEKDILTTDGVHLNDRGNSFVAEHMMSTFDGLGLFFPQK